MSSLMSKIKGQMEKPINLLLFDHFMISLHSYGAENENLKAEAVTFYVFNAESYAQP